MLFFEGRRKLNGKVSRVLQIGQGDDRKIDMGHVCRHKGLSQRISSNGHIRSLIEKITVFFRNSMLCSNFTENSVKWHLYIPGDCSSKY